VKTPTEFIQRIHNKTKLS